MNIHTFRTRVMCFLNDLEGAVKAGPDGSDEQLQAIEGVRVKHGMDDGLVVTQS